MAAFEPFQPLTHSGVAGSTQIVVLSSTSQTVQIPSSLSQGQTSVLATLFNGNTTLPVIAYVRLSVESSTAIAATSTDCPMVASTFVPSVRLFASPNPGGTYNIAVICTVAPSISATIYFTPGQGGIL